MEPIPLRYSGYHDYLGRWVVIDDTVGEDGVVVAASEDGLTLADIHSVTHENSRIAHPEQWMVEAATAQAAESFAKACEEHGIGPDRGKIEHPGRVKP